MCGPASERCTQAASAGQFGLGVDGREDLVDLRRPEVPEDHGPWDADVALPLYEDLPATALISPSSARTLVVSTS